MTTIKSFHDRLAKIGIEVTFFGNYPWVYLDKVNGVKVKTKHASKHGFTVFFSAIKPGQPEHKITDIPLIFNTIRNILKAQCDDKKI